MSVKFHQISLKEYFSTVRISLLTVPFPFFSFSKIILTFWNLFHLSFSSHLP